METLNRFECGSVHIKCASFNRTLFNPFSFFKQIASNSCDSGLASVHVEGGDKNRSQFLQKDTDDCFGIPSVISIVFRRQATQRFAPFGTIGVPQSAQRTLWIGADWTNSMVVVCGFGMEERGIVNELTNRLPDIFRSD
jgi:hypothetical protein